MVENIQIDLKNSYEERFEEIKASYEINTKPNVVNVFIEKESNNTRETTNNIVVTYIRYACHI